MNIKPIETHYAGCRFRSRLEARWAVFFDHLGIEWEYEPQGYLVGPNGNQPYLPDFWLPADRIWVEVKGSEAQLDLQLLANAVVPRWGLPDAPNWGRMLLLGPIPRISDGDFVNHTCFTFRKGDIQFSHVGFSRETQFHSLDLLPLFDGDVVGIDDGSPLDSRNYLAADIRQGCEGFRLPIHDAYRAARSARFEHGESP